MQLDNNQSKLKRHLIYSWKFPHIIPYFLIRIENDRLEIVYGDKANNTKRVLLIADQQAGVMVTPGHAKQLPKDYIANFLEEDLNNEKFISRSNY